MRLQRCARGAAKSASPHARRPPPPPPPQAALPTPRGGQEGAQQQQQQQRRELQDLQQEATPTLSARLTAPAPSAAAAQPASADSDSDGVVGGVQDASLTERVHQHWHELPARYKVVLATSASFVVCNMDKVWQRCLLCPVPGVDTPPPCAHLHLLWLAACLQVNISVAIVPMAQEFHWSPTVAGLVQSSFFWGYLLSQVQCGAVQCSAGWRAIKAIRLPPLLTSCLMVVTCWAVRHCCHCCCCCRCQAAWQRRGSAAAACCPPAYSFGLRPRQVREATITAVADCSAG